MRHRLVLLFVCLLFYVNGTAQVTEAPLDSGDNNTNSSTYDTTVSITPTAGRLIVYSVSNSLATNPPGTLTGITGNGVTWVPITGATSFIETSDLTTRRITSFCGITSSPSAGTSRMTFSGTQTGAQWSIAEFAGNYTGVTNCNTLVRNVVPGTQLNSTTITITLGTFASANNATYGAVTNDQNGAITNGSGFTEIHEVAGASPNRSTETEWRNDNDTTVDASNASATSDWAGIGFEIILTPAVGTTKNLMMMGIGQ